jgi:hypothetical protein
MDAASDTSPAASSLPARPIPNDSSPQLQGRVIVESVDLLHSLILHRQPPHPIHRSDAPHDILTNVSDNDLQTLTRHILNTLHSRGLAFPSVVPLSQSTPSLLPVLPRNQISMIMLVLSRLHALVFHKNTMAHQIN